MAVEAPYLPPEWQQWQAPAYYVPAGPQQYYAAPPQPQAMAPPGWIPSAAAYVARVPPPMAVPGRGHPGGAYSVYGAQQQLHGHWGGAQPGAPPAAPQGADARQQGLPPRAPSPGGYGGPRAAAPGGYGPAPAASAPPPPSSSFEHAHLARRNARLEERLADAAREKREMAAHFEQLLAQARADAERQAAEAVGSRVAPLEAELRGVAEAAERYRAERDFLHSQLTSAAAARAQLETALQEARAEVLAAQQQQQQRARDESEALASSKGGPASQLLASARRSRELAAEKERETQMEEALRLAETARVASQVAQAEVAALRERSEALRSERDDAKSEAHRWEARYRDMVAQRASSPAALAAMPSAPEALSQLHQADLSISESSHLAEQLSAAKDELHRLRTAHDAALARLAQQGRLLAAAAAASVDARRAAAEERETFAEPVAASSGSGDRGDGRQHEGGRLAASVVCARLETLLVEVQGVAGVALASGGARWDDDVQDAEDEESGSHSVTPGEAVARHALAKARTAMVDLEAKQREQRDDDGDMVRALLELKALCLHVIVVCAAMARRKQQPEHHRGRMSQTAAAAAARVSAPGDAQRHRRVSQGSSSQRSGGADEDDLGGPVWPQHHQQQQEAAQHHRPSRQRETAVISPTPVPADDSPREPPSRRDGGATDAAQQQPVWMLQRRGQSRSASPYGRRSTEGDRVDRSVSPHPSWWTNDRYMHDADDGARAAALTRRASSAQGRPWGRDTAAADQSEQQQQQHSRGRAYGTRPDTPPVGIQRPAPISPYAASAARGASALAARRLTPLRSSADNTVFPARRASSPVPLRPRSAAESRPAWSQVSAGTPMRVTRTGLMPREPASSPTVRVALPKWR